MTCYESKNKIIVNCPVAMTSSQQLGYFDIFVNYAYISHKENVTIYRQLNAKCQMRLLNLILKSCISKWGWNSLVTKITIVNANVYTIELQLTTPKAFVI